MANPAKDEAEAQIHETPTEARQGVNVGWQMRVFVISMLAAVIALGLFLIPH